MEIKGGRVEEELHKANIPLVIDTYDDIFSDFDPRPFSERALSDDFLLECKKAALDKGEGVELIISMPANLRNINSELKIKKRLKEHFKKYHLKKESELKKIKQEGFTWVIMGIAILIGVIFGSLNISNTLLQSIIVIFEIPSWFLVWEGMSKILIESRKLEPDGLFYHKMASAQITFISI